MVAPFVASLLGGLKAGGKALGGKVLAGLGNAASQELINSLLGGSNQPLNGFQGSLPTLNTTFDIPNVSDRLIRGGLR